MSLVRIIFEIEHPLGSGQVDHAPHSFQVQLTAKFLKTKNRNNNPYYCQETRYTYDSRHLYCMQMSLVYLLLYMPCHYFLDTISQSLICPLSRLAYMF